MICRIFEFYTESGLSHPEKTFKCDECEYAKDGHCTICHDCDIHLTREHFGWMISRKITSVRGCDIPELEKCISMVRMIHPVHNTVWVRKRLTKEDKVVYDIRDGKKTFCNGTLAEMNEYLKEDQNYDGRDLTEEDFSYE